MNFFNEKTLQNLLGGVKVTFYDYLIEEFGYDEPILVEEIVEKTGENKATVRQRLSRLVLKKQLEQWASEMQKRL